MKIIEAGGRSKLSGVGKPYDIIISEAPNRAHKSIDPNLTKIEIDRELKSFAEIFSCIEKESAEF